MTTDSDSRGLHAQSLWTGASCVGTIEDGDDFVLPDGEILEVTPTHRLRIECGGRLILGRESILRVCGCAQCVGDVPAAPEASLFVAAGGYVILQEGAFLQCPPEADICFEAGADGEDPALSDEEVLRRTLKAAFELFPGARLQLGDSRFGVSEANQAAQTAVLYSARVNASGRVVPGTAEYTLLHAGQDGPEFS